MTDDALTVITWNDADVITRLTEVFAEMADANPFFADELERAETWDDAYDTAYKYLEGDIHGLCKRLFGDRHIDQKPIYLALEAVILMRTTDAPQSERLT